MKVRVRFAKYGSIRYLGHLDMMRYFQKANRRANLPIAYSEGFHPHQIMSFASPLGVGITSDGEYMDLTLTQEMSCEEIRQRLQEEMTDEVRIVSVHRLKDDCKKAMAILEAASYIVFFRSYEGGAVLNRDTLQEGSGTATSCRAPKTTSLAATSMPEPSGASLCTPSLPSSRNHRCWWASSSCCSTACLKDCWPRCRHCSSSMLATTADSACRHKSMDWFRAPWASSGSRSAASWAASQPDATD